MDNLLYFPYISIPNTPWLYKSLLYWDAIDTITPRSYLRRPDKFNGPYMNELLEAELVRPVMPGNYVYDIPDFSNNFLMYVDKKCSSSEENFLVKGIDLKNLTQIHLEKMDDIAYELVERGLALKNNRWVYVHKSIANDFMLYLATLLGAMRNSQPITDNILNVNSSFSTISKEQAIFFNREEIRRNVLNHAFPTPNEIFKVSELLDFKLRNEKQLKNFRKHIEQELLKIDGALEHVKDEMLSALIKDIESEKQSISEKMKEKWNVFDSGTFIQLGANSITAMNAVQSGTNLSVAGAALTIVNTALSTMKKVRNNKKEILSGPIAYAFLVNQKWSNT